MDANQQPIYTVSQLNHEAKLLLEGSFTTVWLLGEISNLARPASGHLYFSLKDQNAKVHCALFRQSSRRLPFTPENGQQVLVHARVSLYEARGEFQLIVSHVELAGEGALQIAFEQLKKKLAAQGLFAPEHKKPLPAFPQAIGVITSASGAAIRDILNVLARRCRATEVIIYPTLVQGQQAAEQIANTISLANQRRECEVLLLARGGGSLEDLWPFNEEIVAQAIFQSKIPIVSGVGHEIDFTIADFVADLRAPTPSAAAEQASPDIRQWQTKLHHRFQRLTALIIHQMQLYQQQLKALRQRLRHPQQQLNEYAKSLNQQQHQLLFAIQQQLKAKKMQLAALAQQLDTVSPLNTLQRGYAIATRTRDSKIIFDSRAVKPNDAIQLTLAKGKLHCIVEHTTDN